MKGKTKHEAALLLLMLCCSASALSTGEPVGGVPAGSGRETSLAQAARLYPGESREMAGRREQAKQRQRRIIYNNDGNDLVSKGHAGSELPVRLNSLEEFLRLRTEPAVGMQVDSIFYCTGVTTLYGHDTHVAERFDDLVDAIKDASETGRNFRHNMRVLRQAGVDQLSATIRRAHEAGMEIFWTHRINDTHDSVLGWPYLLSQWKRGHPEYLMGVPEDTQKYPQSSPRYWWSTLDFEKAEVRNYLYRITEEVCRQYNVDGIEIDYWRYPMFFRPNLDGKPATTEQLDILTEFQRAIRKMAVREGEKKGRPILVAARVPMSVDGCRNVGIDIERWLREDLLDLMAVGNGEGWPNMPAKEIVTLGHRHGVPVYPCIKQGGFGHGDVESWRASASNAWRAGADGLYFFNHFPSEPSPQFKELGDPVKLATLDKLFAATAPYTQGHCRLAEVLPSSMALPAIVSAGGQPAAVALQIGDDVSRAAERKLLDSTVMKVRLSAPKSLDALEVRLNGELLVPTAMDVAGGWLTFKPQPSRYRLGGNEVSFRLAGAAGDRPNRAQVLAVEVRVQCNQ